MGLFSPPRGLWGHAGTHRCVSKASSSRPVHRGARPMGSVLVRAPLAQYPHPVLEPENNCSATCCPARVEEPPMTQVCQGQPPQQSSGAFQDTLQVKGFPSVPRFCEALFSFGFLYQLRFHISVPPQHWSTDRLLISQCHHTSFSLLPPFSTWGGKEGKGIQYLTQFPFLTGIYVNSAQWSARLRAQICLNARYWPWHLGEDILLLIPLSCEHQKQRRRKMLWSSSSS